MVNQIIGSPRKSKKSSKRTNHEKDYQKAMYKLKLSAFENKKAYEIAKLRAKSKGLI